MYKQTIKLENEWFRNDADREKDALHLLVIGGTHGNESNAVKMVSEFLGKINPRSTAGWWQNTYFNRVTVINALNQTGLKYNEREFIQEEKAETNDLNRYFNITNQPTKEAVMDELESAIKDADIVVDVHNSPNILPCISIALNKNAPAYIDWAIRSETQFILTDDTPTIKRHADIDLGKIAFTYEFSGMGFDTRSNLSQLEYDVDTFEKFLTAIGKLWIFDKVFEREWEYGGKSRDVKLPKHTFWKKENNSYLNYLPYVYEKKSFQLPTYADGVYKYLRGNPLGHYSKGEQIVLIENPIEHSIEGEVRAPCDGILIDVDDSYWACKDGILGDFQPDLDQSVFDYYKEEEKQKEKEMRYSEKVEV